MIKRSTQKVVAVANMKWSFIRGSNHGVTVKKVLHKKGHDFLDELQ